MQRHHVPAIAFAILVLLAIAAYLPGTAGPFLFDDTVNIVSNTKIHLQSMDFFTLKQAAYSGDAGMLGRPIAMISFALNYYFTGTNPFFFKATNLGIHILNGVCLFGLTYKIIRAYHVCNQRPIEPALVLWISAVTAGSWLLHPLNLTSVLYVVQRMTSLSSLFIFLAMLCYVHGREQSLIGKNGWIWILTSYCVFLPLAMLCKENGALLPVYLLLIEIALFRLRAKSLRMKYQLIVLFCATVAIPFLASVLYIAANPVWLIAAYRIRDFTMAERLLTESRILWNYIGWAFVPDITALGLYHDDFPLSTSLLKPLSTLPALIGLFSLFVIALIAMRSYAIASFGILFFLAAHSMESTVLGLELMHEHRNYVPIYGLLLALSYYLLSPTFHYDSLRLRRIAVVAFIGMLFGATYLRATHWGNPIQMAELEVNHHPDSIAANIGMATTYATLPIHNQIEANLYYQYAYEYFSRAADLSPKDTLGLFGLIVINSRNNLDVEEAWIRSLAKRLKNYPFTAGSQNALMNLEKCVSAKICSVPTQMMETLFQAALDNSTLHGKARSGVLFAWSDFLFELKRDGDAAAIAAYDAVKTSPTYPEFRVTLIKFLIDMNRYAEARAQIADMRHIDTMLVYEKDLDKLAELIRATPATVN